MTDVTPTVRREYLLRTRVDEMHSDGPRGCADRATGGVFRVARRRGARAALRAHEPLGMLMIDIDHFKAYNDHYGHPVGDQCLRDVAAVLPWCAAPGDNRLATAEKSLESVARHAFVRRGRGGPGNIGAGAPLGPASRGQPRG